MAMKQYRTYSFILYSKANFDPAAEWGHTLSNVQPFKPTEPIEASIS